MREKFRFFAGDLGFGIWDLLGLRPYCAISFKFENGVRR